LPTDAAELEQCRAGSRMRKPSGVAPGRLFSLGSTASLASKERRQQTGFEMGHLSFAGRPQSGLPLLVRKG